MTTTITSGAVSIPVQFRRGYTVTRESGNILHPIIGRVDPDVTLKAAGLRTGTLPLVCMSHSDALTLANLNAQGAVLELADTDFPLADMLYVASGQIILEQDESSEFWWVSVDYAEVL